MFVEDFQLLKERELVFQRKSSLQGSHDCRLRKKNQDFSIVLFRFQVSEVGRKLVEKCARAAVPGEVRGHPWICS